MQATTTRRRRTILILLALLLVAAAGALVPWKRITRRIARSLRGPWPGLFHDPEGLAIDDGGNLYVADEDPGSLSVLDPSGKRIAHIEFLPGLEERLTRGDSMVVPRKGRVILIGLHRLVEVDLDAPGGPRLVRMIGERGAGPGQIEDGEGLALDRESGDLYMTDEDNRRVHVFAGDGRLVKTWQVSAEPEGICLAGDRVYVTFAKECWVGCFSRDGEMKFRFGKKGSGPGDFDIPDYVTVSPRGELLVTDQKNHRIQVFDLEGKHLRTLGGPGSAPGRFNDPEDIAFDRDGNIVVADGGNHRVQVLSPSGEPIRVLE
jgi:sugar lactone lactonase YvrE